MKSNDSTPRSNELMGPELSQNDISDIKAVFDSIVDAVGLRECCANIIYSNWMYFTAIIQRQHAPDIIYQVSQSLNTDQNTLRIRIELFSGDTRPGMTGLDYLRQKEEPNNSRVLDTASRSLLLGAEQSNLTATLRKTLVKTKATLIQESRLSPDDVSGVEGQSDYDLEKLNPIFVGKNSLWSDELTPVQTDAYSSFANSDDTTSNQP